MRSIRRFLALLAMVSIGAVLGTVAAEAKGPSDATIDGPGIVTPIEVRPPGSHTIGGDLAALIKDSKIFSGLWCPRCDDRLRTQPTDRFGPRYTVTYTMALEGDAQASNDTVVQYIYPNAAPQPVVYVPSHQSFWNTDTVGGWFLARPRLRGLLIGLGVPVDAVPSSMSPAPSPDREGVRWLVPAATVAAIAFLLMGIFVATRRIRGSRRPASA